MRQILTISGWEFRRYIKSRSFLLATFISPIILAAIIAIPSFFYQNSRFTRPQTIGVVEFDSINYQKILSEHFNDSLDSENGFSEIALRKIQADTSAVLAGFFVRQENLRIERDSLDDAYNKIKERRKYIFQQGASKRREQQLKETYEELHRTRESRDLAVIEYNRIESITDSIIRKAVFDKADSLLTAKTIQGYIVIEPDLFKQGKIEFHSLLPINFFRIDRLKQMLQELLVEERMREEGITSSQIQEWLKPIEIQELRLEGSQKREFNVMLTYLIPIIAVLFLFISIFTSSGYLFNGMLAEKTNRIIEHLLGSVNSLQLIFGKILGLGILGLLQIIVWILVAAAAVLSHLILQKDAGFLTIQNAGIFILYFILGYLFFSAVFIGGGSLFSSEEEARHFNQLMRIVSILPIILAILVLETPNSLLVRILSFIPFLTPSFMILRTPLGQPPPIDYWISVGIMIVFIVLSLFFAIRVFRAGNFVHNRKLGSRELLALLKKG